MPSTTVHIPDALLIKIDKLVKQKGITRNKFVIHACEKALESSAGQWPKDFFENNMDKKSLNLLRESVAEMEAAILSRRKSRKGVDL